ncbi:MAG: adenine phosphoribosyltransferase [Acidimicrobiales bacterium]
MAADDTSVEAVARARELVRDVADFPSPGVTFKDITPLLGDAAAFAAVVEALAVGALAAAGGGGVDLVAGIEARGFLIGAPVALHLGAGFVPVRKPGKLPWTTVRRDYALEYGTDALEIHDDAVRPGARVLVVDDVLATGGTAAATVALLEDLGAAVVGVAVLVELGFLAGRAKLSGHPVTSLLAW